MFRTLIILKWILISSSCTYLYASWAFPCAVSLSFSVHLLLGTWRIIWDYLTGSIIFCGSWLFEWLGWACPSCVSTLAELLVGSYNMPLNMRKAKVIRYLFLVNVFQGVFSFHFAHVFSEHKKKKNQVEC